MVVISLKSILNIEQHSVLHAYYASKIKRGNNSDIKVASPIRTLSTPGSG
jgi:hypothetical protein